MRVASALAIPQLDISLNNSIEVKDRATFLSVASAICRAAQLIADPIIGLLIDVRGIYFIVAIFSLVSFIILLLAIKYLKYTASLMEYL